MKSLDLDIEYRLRIDIKPLLFLEIIRKRLLVLFLYIVKFIKNCFIIKISSQILKLHRIFLETGADQLLDLICQERIAVNQPAAECYTVGLVIELLRIDLIEIVKL